MAASLAADIPTFTALGWARIASKVLAMVLLLLGCLPFYYLWRMFAGHNPWPRVFLGGIAWFAGVDIRVTGHRVESGEFLLANHVSWIDIPAIAAASGAAFVAHDGLAAVPLIRWLCAMNDTVFVARHDRASIARQIEQVRAAIRDTGALAIFPEGTTGNGDELLPFKSSLLSALDPAPAGVAIQPVLLDYGPEAADVAWIGAERGVDNFKRMLARARPITLELHFLPPLEGAALTSRKTIAAAASQAIERELRKRR